MSYDNDADDEPVNSETDSRITRAIKFMRRVSENDSVNRTNADYWRRFRYGEQWPAEIMNSRTLEQRPCLIVNKTDTYCGQVENQQRQQRPRIKVDPTNGEASKKTADVIKGMIRHIENAKGGGDMAYDGGFSGAVTEGRGYWRAMSDYVRDDSFEQELFLMPIDDPGSVYFDDHSIMPDGSDNEETLIVSDMGKDSFKAQYPKAGDGASFIPADMGGFSDADWVQKDVIRVAEYFYIDQDPMKLHKLSDGSVIWEDQNPGEDILRDAGLAIVESRDAVKRRVKWCKMTAIEILDERELPGRWIPVFPCYGKITIIDGKRKYSGLVKNAVSPQQMLNFWKTAMTESVALAPKVKWLIAEGQDEGHENEWATANISAKPTLRYKPTDAGGAPAAPPQRLQPEPPPEGAMAMAASVDQDLTSVLGIIDPAMRISGNVSGKALNAERQQSDNGTFHLYDNMTRSIAFTGRYFLDVMKYYYPEPGRVVRIIGDDGQSSTEQINAQHPQDPAKIINDVTVGQYDVVMDTGPGFNTKRQEAVANMMPLFEKNEQLMQTAGDIMFRNMDFPGAEVIADRLAAANPLAQIDEKSEIPPGVQMKLKQQEQTIQQMQQDIQQMQLEQKYKMSVVQAHEEAATRREMIKTTANIHIEDQENRAWAEDTRTEAETRRHDTMVRSHTALAVAEINQAGKIITQDKDHKHDAAQFEKVAAHEDSQLKQTAAKKD